MKPNFKIIGFDIRQKDYSRISADLMVWDRDETVYERLKSSLSLTENSFQILNLTDNEMRLVQGQLKATKTRIIALSIPCDVFNHYVKRIYNLADKMADFECEKSDFDICDLDGFFSFFDMQKQITKDEFDKMDWVEKLAIVEKADNLIIEHSPFSLIKIEIVKV